MGWQLGAMSSCCMQQLTLFGLNPNLPIKMQQPLKWHFMLFHQTILQLLPLQLMLGLTLAPYSREIYSKFVFGKLPFSLENAKVTFKKIFWSFSMVVAPLTTLRLRAPGPLWWTLKAQDAFEELMRRLTTSLDPSFSCFETPFSHLHSLQAL